VFAEHENACAKLGGCKTSSRVAAFDFNVRTFLHEIRRTLPYVPPIPVAALKSLHETQDYKGMVRLVKRAMNIEHVTFQVVWVPPSSANKGAHKDSPAWVQLPVDMPFYGTKAFRELTIKMYFRQEFVEKAYDEATVIIAHELSHVVLESIRHPLRGCEKVVDLTAMLLGFSRLFGSACYKEQRVGNIIKVDKLGYLSRAEVQLANHILAQEQPHWAWELANRILARGHRNWYPGFRQQARQVTIFLGVALCIGVGTWIFSTSSPSQRRFQIADIASTNNPQPYPPSEETAHHQTQPTPATNSLSTQTAQIQTRLVQLGYLADRPDGVWGPRSHNALRAFKAANGLVLNDFWDDATIATLFSESAAYAPAPIMPGAKR
jgi:hypothetical protein